MGYNIQNIYQKYGRIVNSKIFSCFFLQWLDLLKYFFDFFSKLIIIFVKFSYFESNAVRVD